MKYQRKLDPKRDLKGATPESLARPVESPIQAAIGAPCWEVRYLG